MPCPECGGSEFSITAFCAHPHFDLIEDEPELEPRAQQYFDSLIVAESAPGVATNRVSPVLNWRDRAGLWPFFDSLDRLDG